MMIEGQVSSEACTDGMPAKRLKVEEEGSKQSEGAMKSPVSLFEGLLVIERSSAELDGESPAFNLCGSSFDTQSNLLSFE